MRRSTSFSACTIICPIGYFFVICSIRMTTGPFGSAMRGHSRISISLRIFWPLYLYPGTFFQIFAERRIRTGNDLITSSNAGFNLDEIVVSDSCLDRDEIGFVSLFVKNDALELLHG